MSNNLTPIEGYSIPHGGNNNGNGGTTVINNYGSANIPSDLNVTTITAAKGDINTLNGVALTFDDGRVTYLDADYVRAGNIKGNELDYVNGKLSSLQSDEINVGKITTDEMEAIKAWVQTLSSNKITTDYLEVVKQAHFFELVIDKVKSVGGSLLISATSCVADYVKALKTRGGVLVETTLDDVDAEYYDVYFLANGADGKDINNEWEVNDQAYCQSFNIHPGTSYDTTNKYYWRLVTSILDDTWQSQYDGYMNLSTGAVLSDAPVQDPTLNSVYLYRPQVHYTLPNDENPQSPITGYIDEGWTVTTQTGAYWDDRTSEVQPSSGIVGIFSTSDTLNGLILTPTEGSNLSQAIPDKFIIFCCRTPTYLGYTKCRLTFTVFYTNGQSEIFVAPVSAQQSYAFNLSEECMIEKIIITNADAPAWKKVHGIRLSNIYGEYAHGVSNTTDIPSIGDNIVQLGYQYQHIYLDDPNSGYPFNGTDAEKKAWVDAWKVDNADIYNRASAQLITTNSNSPDSEIKPPAYAQYAGINDFNLINHRGTWIDATGGYFKGKLVTTSGNFIDITDQGLSVNAEYYKIIPEYNIITVDNSNIVTPQTLNVRFLVSGQTQLSSTVPSGFTFNYTIMSSPVLQITAGNTVAINTSGMTNNGKLKMWLTNDTTGAIVDSFDMVCSAVTASAGADAEYDVMIPIKEDFFVNMTQNQGTSLYENIIGKLYVDLVYAVAHIKGDQVTYVSGQMPMPELTNYVLNIDTGITAPQGETRTPQTSFRTTSGSIVTGTYKINGTTVDAIRCTTNNILYDIWGSNSSTYNNYYAICQSSDDIMYRAPLRLDVTLLKNGANKDSHSIPLIFKASNIFSVTDTALNSIYQGLTGTSDGYSITGLSYIRQSWDNIKLGVTNMQTQDWNGIPEDNNVEQYIYKLTNTTTIGVPSDTAWNVTPAGWDSLYANVTPTGANPYLWISHRTRTYDETTGTYSNPSSWSTPELFERYGIARQANINSAQLSIEADRINSTVSQNYYNKSEIDQTAANIELSVYDNLNKTGINIENQKITISAENTDINGNLNLRNSDNGIVMYDSNGNPRINIHSSNIGSKNAVTAVEITGLLNSTRQQIFEEFNYTTNDSYPAYKLGYLTVGTTIRLDKIFFNTNKGNSYQAWTGSISYQVKIYKTDIGSESNVVKTFSGTANGCTLKTVNQSYTLTNANGDGNYFVAINYTGSIGASVVDYFQGQPTYYMTINTQSLTDIGTNGLQVKQGVNKYAYFGSECTELRYNGAGLKIAGSDDNDHIVKQYGGKTSGNTSTEIWENVGNSMNIFHMTHNLYKEFKLRTNTDGYGDPTFATIHPCVDMVICEMSGCTVKLSKYYATDTSIPPFNGVEIPIGKKLYVKGCSDTQVKTESFCYIIPKSSAYNSTSSSVTIGSDLRCYIYTGNGKWLETY